MLGTMGGKRGVLSGAYGRPSGSAQKEWAVSCSGDLLLLPLLLFRFEFSASRRRKPPRSGEQLVCLRSSVAGPESPRETTALNQPRTPQRLSQGGPMAAPHWPQDHRRARPKTAPERRVNNNSNSDVSSFALGTPRPPERTRRGRTGAILGPS